MLVWKPSLTGIHRFHLQHPASTAATLYCMKHSPWLLSCRSPFEITSLIEILPMPVLPSSRCSDSKRVLQRYIKKKVPFLIWHVPARVATQLVFKIINNYACFNKSLLFVILSDIVCFFKKSVPWRNMHYSQNRTSWCHLRYEQICKLTPCSCYHYMNDKLVGKLVGFLKL